MEIMLAVSLLIASLGWGYSAIHTQFHTQGEAKYKSLWEGMMEAAGQLAQEKADVECELEIADSNYKMAMAQLEKVDEQVADLAENLPSLSAETQVIPAPEQPTPQSSDEHPVWKFAESNDDLMSAWELTEPSMASRPAHMRLSLWFTFCGNLPELTREALENAVQKASL